MSEDEPTRRLRLEGSTSDTIPRVNFDPQSHTWTVRETDYCLFHVEAAIAGAEDLDAVVEGADQRYLRIRRALGQWPRTAPTARHRERLLKLNYWLYGQSAVPDTAMPPGAAGPAGVVFAVRNFPWSEFLDAAAGTGRAGHPKRWRDRQARS